MLINVISSAELCCAALHEATRVKGRRQESDRRLLRFHQAVISRRSADWGFLFWLPLWFVENLCTPRCLLKHGSVLEQGAAAVDSRLNCFSPVQALPLPWKMKKPIKSLMDVACAAGTRACLLLIVTEDDIIHRWHFWFTMDLDREGYKHIHVSIDRQEVCKRNIWMFY